MALRNQPYLPLYVQDFISDEKLMLCSAQSTGVYIRLLCIMHKSEFYGKILLKQMFKQTDKQILNFALQLAKFLPYDLPVIEQSLEELLSLEILQIDGDFLIQKRMVKDNNISEKRAKSGKKGGKSTQENNKIFAPDFAKANIQANTENEYENENDIISFEKSEKLFLIPALLKIWTKKNTSYFRDQEKDFPALQKISTDLAQKHGLNVGTLFKNKVAQEAIKLRWGELVTFIVNDKHFQNYSLSQIEKHLQSIFLSYENESHITTHQKPKSGKSAGAYALADDLKNELGL